MRQLNEKKDPGENWMGSALKLVTFLATDSSILRVRSFFYKDTRKINTFLFYKSSKSHRWRNLYELSHSVLEQILAKTTCLLTPHCSCQEFSDLNKCHENKSQLCFFPSVLGSLADLILYPNHKSTLHSNKDWKGNNITGNNNLFPPSPVHTHRAL